jgi:sortase A
LLGGLLLLITLGAILDAELFQNRLSRRLEALHAPRKTPGNLARAEATRREAKTSGLIGRIEIERLGVSVLVVEGTSSKALRRGVGHVHGTAFPGEPGNVGLAGHRDTYFRPLRKIERGDRIRLRTPDGQFVYQVDTALIVSPRRGDLLHSDDRSRLTLVTCYPFYYIGPAPRRFVVQAHEVDRASKLAARPKPTRGAYVASTLP